MTVCQLQDRFQSADRFSTDTSHALQPSSVGRTHIAAQGRHICSREVSFVLGNNPLTRTMRLGWCKWKNPADGGSAEICLSGSLLFPQNTTSSSFKSHISHTRRSFRGDCFIPGEGTTTDKRIYLLQIIKPESPPGHRGTHCPFKSELLDEPGADQNSFIRTAHRRKGGGVTEWRSRVEDTSKQTEQKLRAIGSEW